MGDDYDDSEFLSLANAGEGPSASIDRMKKNSEKQESSFWSKGMEGLLPEAFKGGAKKNMGSKKPTEEGGADEELERKKAKEKTEAARLVRKHNCYLRSNAIRKILVEGGYHCQPLVPGTSLAVVNAQLDDINTIRNAHMSKQAAAMIMDQVNRLTESFVPELKGTPSLSDVWRHESSKEGSQIQLDMEELSIELEPYLTMGFWGRFAGDYIMLIQQLRTVKADPSFRAQQAARENLSNQYDSDAEAEVDNL